MISRHHILPTPAISPSNALSFSLVSHTLRTAHLAAVLLPSPHCVELSRYCHKTACWLVRVVGVASTHSLRGQHLYQRHNDQVSDVMRCFSRRATCAGRITLPSRDVSKAAHPAYSYHAAVHARCIASAAAPLPSRRPADTRVDINLIANRLSVDALLTAYRQSPSTQTLTPLLATLGIHQHLYQLSTHLRTKLSPASATAKLFFAPASTSSTHSDASTASPAALTFEAVSVQQLEDEVLSEHIVKTFCHQPPSAAAPTSKPLPVVVESEWRTERNKMRGMGVQSHSMRVLVRVPQPLAAAFPASLLSASSTVLSSEYASFVLTDSHDAGGVARNEELVAVLPGLLGMGGLTEAEWVWLLSDLCTFPSDVAFDVLSAALEKGYKH